MSDQNQNYTNDGFSQSPDLASLRLNLAKLQNLDLKDKSAQEISEIINHYLDLIPVVSGKYAIEKFNSFQFYRVRSHIDTEKEDLNLIQTYSYPLPQYCKENGRANVKNMSVFYCSNHAITALIESKPSIGEIGYLSFWQGRTTKEMDAGILLPKSLPKENIWSELSNDLYSHIEQTMNERLKENSELFHEKLRFVANLFLTEVSPYSITSLIAYELIYGRGRKDFIIYPSFANDSYSCNLAIHPNVVDNYMKFIKVIRFKVIDIEGQTFKISTGRVGELYKNNMTWRDASQKELDFSLFAI